MIDLSLEEYSKLLGALYDGAMESSPWQSFLLELNRLLDLRACYLFLRFPDIDDDGLMFCSVSELANTPENPRTIYSEQFYASDPLVIFSLNEVVLIDDLVDEQDLLSSQFYQMCMKPNGIRHTAGIDMEFDNKQRFCFRLSRSAKQGPFSQIEQQFIEMLAEHIKRAVVAGEKLVRFDSERRLWANTISGSAVGLVMLDETGSIVRSNAIADQYMREKDGLAQIHKSIHFSNTELNKLFREYMREALSAQKAGEPIPVHALSVPRPSGKPDYEIVIKIIPIDPMIDPRGSPHLSVLIYSPQQQGDIDPQVLMKLYKLTATEASVAIALGRGETLEQLATNLGMKPNTARAHLRAIFSKTGVTQQTQLVGLVLKSLAALP